MFDLNELVNSYIEKGDGVIADDDDYFESDNEEEDDVEEMKDSLKKLYSFENGEAIKNATLQVEKAIRHIIKDISSSSSYSEFKLKLMIQLRDQGFNAGLCKSKWKHNGIIPTGFYEYIDANINGTRYIIELCPAEDFKIVKPTKQYASLLGVFPPIMVCKEKEFKKIARFMCDAIKKSMHHKEMNVPPWRRYRYAEVKWFGSYERITNELSTKSVANSNVGSKGVIEFLSFPVKSCYQTRRKDYGGRGLLAMVMNGAT